MTFKLTSSSDRIKGHAPTWHSQFTQDKIFHSFLAFCLLMRQFPASDRMSMFFPPERLKLNWLNCRHQENLRLKFIEEKWKFFHLKRFFMQQSWQKIIFYSTIFEIYGKINVEKNLKLNGCFEMCKQTMKRNKFRVFNEKVQNEVRLILSDRKMKILKIQWSNEGKFIVFLIRWNEKLK